VSYYVAVPPLTQKMKYLLATVLEERGYIDVEYHNGGWEDKATGTVLPHLRFDKQEDAAVYVLSFGGIVRKTVPLREEDLFGDGNDFSI
jgi:hypothetical protein